MVRGSLVIRSVIAGLLLLCVNLASAQSYPSKPIRIVTLGAGGGADFTARIVAQGIAGSLGQPVVVDNRATGIIASEVASRSQPDGHTLLVGGNSIWVLPLLQKAPYDPVKDLAAVSLLVREILVLGVNPSITVNSTKDLIALAKAKPGVLNFGSSTIGGSNHLAGELFKSMAGVNIVHIPYKGTSAAVTALVSGETQTGFFDAGVMNPLMKSGKLKGLAVSSAAPSALVPGLPTVAASGVPGFEATGITGIWAPIGTPGPIINRLNQEIARALNQVEVREKFFNAVVETVGSSPEIFASTIKSEIATTSKVIKDANIRVE